MVLEQFTQSSPVIQALAGGAFYGLLFWAKARVDPDDPQPFCPVAFGLTLGLSALIGGAFALAEVQLTFDSIAFVLLTYAGTIASVEAAIKALIRGDQYVAQRRLDTAADTLVQTTLGLGSNREEITDSIDGGANEMGQMTDGEIRDEWEQNQAQPHAQAGNDTAAARDIEGEGKGEPENENEQAGPEEEPDASSDDPRVIHEGP